MIAQHPTPLKICSAKTEHIDSGIKQSRSDSMSYLLCFIVEALKPASQRKKITPNNGVPNYFCYLLKSCGFIQNRHVVIQSKAVTKVQYSPSLRNNQFFLSRRVYFSQKIIHFKKVRKIRFFKIPIFQKFESFKKITPNKRQANFVGFQTASKSYENARFY